MYRVYRDEKIDHEITAEFNNKTQPNIKRKGSSGNISILRYQDLNKCTTISRTTLGMDIIQKYGKTISKISKIVQHREEQLQSLVKAIQENDELQKARERAQEESEDSENIENDDIEERTLDELIHLKEKDVPFKCKPYIKTAIFENINNRKDYDSKLIISS